MTRLIISLAVLCALFIFIFTGAKLIDNFCDESMAKLDTISELYENGAEEDAKTQFEQLNNHWKKEKNMLFFFVQFDYIYEVDESLEQLGLCVYTDIREDKALDEFRTQKEEVDSKLRYLDDSTSIHWSTIF